MMKRKLIEEVLNEYNKLSSRVYNIASAVETCRSREYTQWCLINDIVVVSYEDLEYSESFCGQTKFPVEWLWSDWETKLEKQKETQKIELENIRKEMKEREEIQEKQYRKELYNKLKEEFEGD